MVESALEFIRIAESHNYQDLCLSMKASNPKVMIEAYRLAVSRMQTFGMNYPLHLGVTEAGDGEDARIKSTIGIGALLNDGIGDTIRVSLTEDPIYEVPVAKALAEKAMKLWDTHKAGKDDPAFDSIDPFSYNRNPSESLEINTDISIGHKHLPRIIVKSLKPTSDYESIIQTVCKSQFDAKENKIEGLMLAINQPEDLCDFLKLQEALKSVVPFFVLDLSEAIDLEHLELTDFPKTDSKLIFSQKFDKSDAHYPVSYTHLRAHET